MGKKPIAYIDADILLYRAVSFIDSEFDGEDVPLPRLAEYYFDWLLRKWMKEIGPVEDYFLVITVGRNFRYDLYEDYKGNRKDIVPHPSFKGLKERVMDRMDVVWEEGIEADDYIGIMCSAADPNRPTVAVSADKDFATVPCRLIVPTSHGRKKPDHYEFTEADADRNWMIQTLMGDVIDNYTGLPGVGVVAATEIVDNPRITKEVDQGVFQRGPRKGQPKPTVWVREEPCSVWQSMVTAASKYGLDEAYVIQQARVARILRHGDYDWKTKEVKLWTP